MRDNVTALTRAVPFPLATLAKASLMHRIFAGTAAGVRQVMKDLSSSALWRQLGDGTRINAEIVLAEVLNNIVEHAYAQISGDIDLALDMRQGQLHCQITDTGHPMPDFTLPEGAFQDLGAIETLPEGGFGWFLIRNLTEELEYRHIGGMNQLSFTLIREQSLR